MTKRNVVVLAGIALVNGLIWTAIEMETSGLRETIQGQRETIARLEETAAFQDSLLGLKDETIAVQQMRLRLRPQITDEDGNIALCGFDEEGRMLAYHVNYVGEAP